MKMEIRQDLNIQGADPELKDYIKELLTTLNPDWLDAKTFGRWTGNIPQYIHQFKEVGEDLIVPRGQLDHLLNDLGRKWEVYDHRVSPESEKIWPEGNIILRPDDQEPAVQKLLSHTGGFLAAPPGSGKTVMGLEACRRLGLKALWLTHRRELKDQAIEEAVDLLELQKDRIGVIHGKKCKIGEQLTVGMIPTLSKRDLDPLSSEFGIVIVDEAHHVPSKTFLTVVNNFSARYVYGLTATPKRRDKLEAVMFNAIGPVVSRIKHHKLEEDGHLMKPTILCKNTGWSPPNSHAMEYHELMEAMVYATDRNTKIVDDVITECKPGNTCIVLVGRTKHAEILTNALQRRGILAGLCVATIDVATEKGEKRKKKAIPKAVRDKIVSDFKSGDLQVLVATYDLLAEGFNYRPLNRLFMASPIKWEGWVEQSLGRIRRPFEGKTDAIAYDYIDESIAMFVKQADSRLFRVYKRMGMHVKGI